MSSNEILAPNYRSDQHNIRQGNDYQNVTVGEGGRAILGNVYADTFSMNILDPCQRPKKTEQEKREDFMRSLSFNVMDSRLVTITIAYRETCSWLYTRAEYLRWQDPEYRAEHHGFLWIKGKPGAGKSTLMKHALQHAQDLDQGNTAILSFLFNARGRDLEKTTEGMYRSLLHQVYKAFPDRLPDVQLSDSTEPENRIWQLPTLQTMLRDALLNFGTATEFVCYIDALDECKEDAIRLAIEYFEELGELAMSRNVKISICFASRHYPNITMQCCQTLNLDGQKEHHKDIQNFVKGKLRRTGITPLTHAELTEEISGRSSGVFLWAELVVQILNKKMDHGATRSQLMSDLDAVPAGIEDLLKSILMDGSDPNNFLLPTLLWVLFSLRPLGAPDLYLATKASAGCLTSEDLDQTETTQEQMRLSILNSSKGLIEFSKDRFATAQFIHESVREYLLNGGLSVLDDSLADNCRAKCHFRLATWCRVGIEIDERRIFRKQVNFSGYAWGALYEHCENACLGGAFQLEFFDTLPKSIQNRVYSYWEPRKPLPLLNALFSLEHDCLVKCLLQRQLRCSTKTGCDLTDARATAHNDETVATIPYLDVDSGRYPNRTTALIMAIECGAKEVVQLLLDCGADPDLDCSYQLPVNLAIGSDRCDIVELLLHRGANTNLARPFDTPLATAMQQPCTRCVTMLLECGTNPDHEGSNYSPLIAAIENEDCSLVELLLNRGANPSLQRTHEFSEYIPLLSAIALKCARCIEMLLDHGADPTGGSADPGIPLIHAIESNDEGIVRTILSRGADVHGSDAQCEKPLAVAISDGPTEIVKILLEHGANVNGGSEELGKPITDAVSSDRCPQEMVCLLLAYGANPDGSSRHIPLHMAIRSRNEAVARLILDAGADVRVTDETGRNSLHVLCSEHPIHYRIWEMNSITEILLDAGVDINATDESHGTALIMAIEIGFFDLARLLVLRGADVNAVDATNGTALMMAAKAGALSVVQVLLDTGADINAIDTTRRTALMIALEMDYIDVAQLLVDRGTNLDMQGHEGVVLYLHLRMTEEDAVAGLDDCDRMSD
jgi:ankyrin repeat protein